MDQVLLDITKVIESSLPAIKADVFRKYVEDSEIIKKDYEKLKNDYAKVCLTIDEMKIQLSDLKSLKLENEKIKSERLTLELDKLKFDVQKQLKDAQIVAEKDKVTLVTSLVNSVFRNIESRKNMLGDILVRNKSRDYNGNEQEFITREPSNITETKTNE